MRTILVTGGKGLVGKGIEQYLQSQEKKYLEDKWIFLSSQDVDLRKEDETKNIFMKYKPTHVVHLAAMVGGLFKNMRLKLQFFLDNMAINTNVLRCCHEFKVEKCVSCLSTCIFPDDIEYPLNEAMIHNGPPHPSNEGYAYAKRMLDVMNRLYREDYGCNFVSVVPTNIYGPFDNFNLEDSHVIPGLIHKCYLAKQNNTDFIVWGSGSPLRQFIYSKDLGELIVWSLDHYNEAQPIILSVGEKDEISIGDVARLVVEAMGFKGNLVFDKSKADGQYKKTASNKKLLSLYPEFKFTPIRQAIQTTCQWFEENYETARK